MALGREKLEELRRHAAEVQAVADQRDAAIKERDGLLNVCLFVRSKLAGFPEGGFHSGLHRQLNEAIAQVEIEIDSSRAMPGTELKSTAVANDGD